VGEGKSEFYELGGEDSERLARISRESGWREEPLGNGGRCIAQVAANAVQLLLEICEQLMQIADLVRLTVDGRM